MNTQIARLTSRSLIKVSGPQAAEFLHNLVTCDVLSLGSGQLAFGALLTPQGKILFDFFVFCTGDGFLLDTDQSQHDGLLKRLMFYRLRANVDLSAVEGDIFAVWPGSEDIGTTDPRSRSLGNRVYDQTCQTDASEIDWHKNRINVGVPHSGLDFDLESIFPHDALMDQFPGSGVNFTKGCYVGQEVVSRMQHRGTARNRFMKVTAAENLETELPSAGTELMAGDRAIGKMGSHQGPNGLALVRLDRAAEAVRAGEDILAGGVTLSLEKPGFATFSWL